MLVHLFDLGVLVVPGDRPCLEFLVCLAHPYFQVHQGYHFLQVVLLAL